MTAAHVWFAKSVQASTGGGIEVLGKLFLANEDFRGRVKRQHIAIQIQAVCFSTDSAAYLDILPPWQVMG